MSISTHQLFDTKMSLFGRKLSHKQRNHHVIAIISMPALDTFANFVLVERRIREQSNLTGGNLSSLCSVEWCFQFCSQFKIVLPKIAGKILSRFELCVGTFFFWIGMLILVINLEPLFCLIARIYYPSHLFSLMPCQQTIMLDAAPFLNFSLVLL